MRPILTPLLPLLAMLAASGAATMAGLLFAFSNFLMRALTQLPPASGMEAMQRINVTIVNPVFLTLFVGTAVAHILVGFVALQPDTAGRLWFLLGAVCYVVGVSGVTALVNVPLNDALAALDPSAAPERWLQYATVWTRWNHLRTVCAFVSAGATLWGVMALASSLSPQGIGPGLR